MFGLSLYHAEIAIAHIATAILAGVAVAIRLYVKIKTKQGVKSDDIFILLTLVFYYAAIATVLHGTSLDSQTTDVY
jgi:formate/nitrite transporter FocA (FNT family)